jgi:hypothetical protein
MKESISLTPFLTRGLLVSERANVYNNPVEIKTAGIMNILFRLCGAGDCYPHNLSSHFLHITSVTGFSWHTFHFFIFYNFHKNDTKNGTGGTCHS